MAKNSYKRGGKEVGPASTYAKPHTMTGQGVDVELHEPTGAAHIDGLVMSAGVVTRGNFKAPKTDGITMRGHGAATKGIKSRGPMA